MRQGAKEQKAISSAAGLAKPVERLTAEREVVGSAPTLSPGRFSLALVVGLLPPHLQSQGKAPLGRDWVPPGTGTNTQGLKITEK